jgi:hypothetical protein
MRPVGSWAHNGSLPCKKRWIFERRPAPRGVIRFPPGCFATLREDPAQNMRGGRSRKYIGMPVNGTNGERPRLRGANGPVSTSG